MLALFHDIDDDWVTDDVPHVLGVIGQAAIEPAAVLLADMANDYWARVSAAKTLGEIGRSQPETRSAGIAHPTAQLEQFAGRPDLWI